ncbi:MAG: hypothetical protein ABIP19_01550 [Dermatophilaceae bacterium]
MAGRSEGIRVGRAHAALTMATAMLIALGVVVALPAAAAVPLLTSGTVTSVTVSSLTVAPDYVRKSVTTPLRIPVTVVVDDPEGTLDYVDVVIGAGLDTTRPLVAGIAVLDAPTSVSGSLRIYKVYVLSPYRDPQGFPTPYGNMQVRARAHDNGMTAATLTGATTIRAATVTRITATPTLVPRGGAVLLRGTLRRFDGKPVAGVPVSIRVVPAGWTKGSYAGSRVTTSTGAFGLVVHAYYTGSWYANAAAKGITLGSYHATWVRVAT